MKCERCIPARAGQPGSDLDPGQSCGVHPRARGATQLQEAAEGVGQGASPRARGNLFPLRRGV